MRDPRHPAGPRVILSEDEPTDTVLPLGQAGTDRRRLSADLPAHRTSHRPAVNTIAADDDDVIAPATRDIYRRDWAEFAAWCRSNGSDPAVLPLSPVLVADYLATLAPSHGASAVRRRVAAIADHHRRRGIGFSATDPAISEVLRGLPRRHRQPVQPAALTEVDLPHLIATCQADLPGVRDRALFLVGLAGGFSRSALVAIDHHHLHIDADGAVIAVPSGRRNRARPVEVRLPRLADPDLCPVRALEAWLQRGNIRRGAVFRGISAHGVVEARLTSAGVRHILLQRAALAKRMAQTDKIPSPHGRRAGLITKSDLADARDKPIAAHTRHTNRPTQRRNRQLASGDNPERSRTPPAGPDRHLAARGAGQGARTQGTHAPADTDWLLNRLTVSGPAAEVARFRAAARGTSAVPWSLDLDQEEARLLAPMASAGP
jgi:site-specific recombinase XerD